MSLIHFPDWWETKTLRLCQRCSYWQLLQLWQLSPCGVRVRLWRFVCVLYDWACADRCSSSAHFHSSLTLSSWTSGAAGAVGSAARRPLMWGVLFVEWHSTLVYVLITVSVIIASKSVFIDSADLAYIKIFIFHSEHLYNKMILCIPITFNIYCPKENWTELNWT